MMSAEAMLAPVVKHGEAAAEHVAWRRQHLLLPKWVAAGLMTLAFAAVFGGGWCYFGAGSFLAQGRVLEWYQSWRLEMSLGMISLGGLLGLFGWLIRTTYERQEQHWRQHLELITRKADALAMQMRLASVASSAPVEAPVPRSDLEAEVSRLSRLNTQLTEELGQRQRMERNIMMQQHDLVRSKDVLEIHVQARTQELQKLQRRYESILNSAGEGICGVDPQGKVMFVNPTAARLLRCDAEDLTGHDVKELFPQLAGFGEAVPTTDPPGPTEVALNRWDGTTFSAEYIRSPLRENDQLVGQVILFKDITERKHAAEALAHKVEELGRSNAELEQFAFVASHDLQEPLRKIRAFGDRLKTKCEEVLTGEGRDYLDRMQNAAARMQTLINDLLTFSRVISRTEPFAPVDLNRITREVLGDLEVRIEKTRAVVEVGELPVIEADPIQIRQLLQNLIGNAMKFHAPDAVPQVRINGKVISTVKGRNGTPPVQLCELTVQDNGIGFDEKYLDRIFAVFQRLHGRQEFEGTGIGLAVCRRIADRHGGSITAQSQPGAGAKFIVTLPLWQTRPKETAA
ncbi:MAG TPA: ATP-binding protein [Dongiaceae bacterium]|nr:ATP-binding protein [Dongiaceae bacterium]